VKQIRRQLSLPWPAGGVTEPAPDVRPPGTKAPAGPDKLSIPPPSAPVFVRNARARRYILRVLADGRVRVTIPRYGSRREAEAFLRTRLAWIADRRRELQASRVDRRWRPGTLVWWRGVLEPVVVFETDTPETVAVGCADVQVVAAPADDYRGVLERAMRRIASVELPRELLELARRHDLTVQGVTIRNQRSRWGSCSRDGRIALNWRLLQMPEPVRQYVLLHELMHLREHNHSERFWALVEAVCPWHLDARRWLRHEGLTLC
jgi:predicted metal-dependent hydrolase